MGVKYEGAGKSEELGQTPPACSPLNPPHSLSLWFVVCSTFTLIYFSLLWVFFFISLPPSLPFSHSAFLLWEMYSL